MPVQYMKDPAGTIHVVDQTGSGEFTLCSRDTSMEDSGGFEGERVDEPASCEECRDAYHVIIEGLKGLRWKRRLRHRPGLDVHR